MSTTQTEPTDILGKIGKFLGTEHNSLRVSIGNTYATKVSLGQAISNINIPDVSGLATQVSLDNYANGTSVFDTLKATRAELGELKVTGKTTIVDTQTIEVSDNILELNLAEDGGETAQTSGLSINRGIGTTTIDHVNNPYLYDGTEIGSGAPYEWSASGNVAVQDFPQSSVDSTNRTLRTMYSVRNPNWSYNLWDLAFSSGNILLRKNIDTNGTTGNNWTQQHTIGTYDESTGVITMIEGWTLTLKEDPLNITRWTIDEFSFGIITSVNNSSADYSAMRVIDGTDPSHYQMQADTLFQAINTRYIIGVYNNGSMLDFVTFQYDGSTNTTSGSSQYFRMQYGDNNTGAKITLIDNENGGIGSGGGTIMHSTLGQIGTWTNQILYLNAGYSITDPVFMANNSSHSTHHLDDFTFNIIGTNTDKATILWDDIANRWKINVGETDADFEANKLYYKNIFAQLTDLPSATDYHGMVAHVHATQKLYFAHGGQWVELISSIGGQTISGALTLTGALGVSSGTNLTINDVAVGDYSSFSNAFTTALNA